MCFVAIAIAVAVAWPLHALAADNATLSDKDREELEVYRNQVPKLVSRLNELEAQAGQNHVSPVVQDSYQNYLVRFYQQAAALRQITLDILNWQIMAGNIVLGLVLFVSISGVVMSAYQLYLSGKLGQDIAAVRLEASAQRVQVTSSIVGIVILVISGIFLLLFLREVYDIRVVDLYRSASDQAHQKVQSQTDAQSLQPTQPTGVPP